MHTTIGATVNQEIKSVSAIKPPRKDARPGRAKHARGRATWKAIQNHGDDLIRVGQIAKETRSAITRYVLFEHLTALEGEGAKRYAYIVARFEKYCTEGRRTTKSPSYERAFGTDQEIERHQRAGTIADYEDAAKKARKEYDKLVKAIAPYGAVAKSALDDFCCSDIEPSDGFRKNLAVVLRVVVKAFGVTEAPRRKRR